MLITQQARMEAIAAKCLKKKRDLGNAGMSSIRNAIKYIHRTEHLRKHPFIKCPYVFVVTISSLVRKGSIEWQRKH
jgi:hypothetical protein